MPCSRHNCNDGASASVKCRQQARSRRDFQIRHLGHKFARAHEACPRYCLIGPHRLPEFTAYLVATLPNLERDDLARHRGSPRRSPGTSHFGCLPSAPVCPPYCQFVKSVQGGSRTATRIILSTGLGASERRSLHLVLGTVIDSESVRLGASWILGHASTGFISLRFSTLRLFGMSHHA